SSIAAHSESVSCSKRDSPKRRASSVRAGGGSAASAAARAAAAWASSGPDAPASRSRSQAKAAARWRAFAACQRSSRSASGVTVGSPHPVEAPGALAEDSRLNGPVLIGGSSSAGAGDQHDRNLVGDRNPVLRLERAPQLRQLLQRHRLE